MPVTARLSRKFYERFGDDIAGEFVDWFNAVDTTYHQQLRELNDLNWERFKAELRSAIAQSEARLTQLFSDKLSDLKAENSDTKTDLKSEISSYRAELKAEISDLRTELKSEISGLRADLKADMLSFKADIMKWMFIYWSGTVLSLGGLMIAILRR